MLLIKLNNLIALAVCLLLQALALGSLNGQTLAGTIIDGQHKTPVPHATVTDLNSKTGGYSDNNGYFELANFTGNYLVVSSLGYLTDTIDVSALSEEQVQISLKRANYQLATITYVAEKKRRKEISLGIQETSGFGVGIEKGGTLITYLPVTDTAGLLESITVQLRKERRAKCADVVRLRLLSAAIINDTITPAGDIYVDGNPVVVSGKASAVTFDLANKAIALPANGFFVGLELLGTDTDCSKSSATTNVRSINTIKAGKKPSVIWGKFLNKEWQYIKHFSENYHLSISVDCVLYVD